MFRLQLLSILSLNTEIKRQMRDLDLVYRRRQYTTENECNDTTLKKCINYGDQRYFSIWNHHKYLSYLFPLHHVHLNTYVMGLHAHYNYFNSCSAGIVFRRQKSDVYRRQILTSKVDPRVERVNVGLTSSTCAQHETSMIMINVLKYLITRWY